MAIRSTAQMVEELGATVAEFKKIVGYAAEHEEKWETAQRARLPYQILEALLAVSGNTSQSEASAQEIETGLRQLVAAIADTISQAHRSAEAAVNLQNLVANASAQAKRGRSGEPEFRI
jgi:hypothetical protein